MSMSLIWEWHQVVDEHGDHGAFLFLCIKVLNETFASYTAYDSQFAEVKTHETSPLPLAVLHFLNLESIFIARALRVSRGAH